MMTDRLTSILTPFRRDRKRDIASGSGPVLLKSKVIQALATEGATPRSSGELPWRTGFGSGLHLLRHQRNDDVLAELARVYVKDALSTWVPEAELIGVEARRDGAKLNIRVRFREKTRTGESETEEAEIAYSLGD